MENNNSAIQALEEEIKQLLSKVDGLKSAVEFLKKGKGITTGNPGKSDYDPESSNKAKIMALLRKNQRFLHIREMAKLAHELEPLVSEEEFQKRFSPALSILRTEDAVVNTRVGKSLMNTFWGSAKWLTVEGEVKKGHEINTEYVKDSSKDEYEI
jgi:hypothetical protein